MHNRYIKIDRRPILAKTVVTLPCHATTAAHTRQRFTGVVDAHRPNGAGSNGAVFSSSLLTTQKPIAARPCSRLS